MLERRPGRLLFIAAVVFAVGMLFFLWPNAPTLPMTDTVDVAPTQYQLGGSECATGAPVWREGPQSKIDDCREAAERYRLQLNDLVQQTRSANASEAQAYLAFTMVWMVLVGTIGGIFTLFAAVAAALYAHKAAIATEASVELAKVTAAETKEVADAGLRPWLQFDIEPHTFQMNDGKASVEYAVRLKNLGKLPATNVFTDGRVYDLSSDLGEIPKHFDARFEPHPGWTPRTILPQGEIEIPATVDCDELAVTAFAGVPGVRPVLAVRAVYRWGTSGAGRTCQSFELIHLGKAEMQRFIPIAVDDATRERFQVAQTQFDAIW